MPGRPARWAVLGVGRTAGSAGRTGSGSWRGRRRRDHGVQRRRPSVRSSILEHDGQNQDGKTAVHACCLRLAGPGNRHGVRSRNRRVRLRADEPVLGVGWTWPGQHDWRICGAVRPPGRDTSGSDSSAATLAKVAGALLALAMVRSWGRAVPRRWLLAGSAVASALLVVYGGLNVLLGALVLSGVIYPTGSVDRTALRWHVGVWDLWFLVWGSCWRWLPPATGAGR